MTALLFLIFKPVASGGLALLLKKHFQTGHELVRCIHVGGERKIAPLGESLHNKLNPWPLSYTVLLSGTIHMNNEAKNLFIIIYLTFI